MSYSDRRAAGYVQWGETGRRRGVSDRRVLPDGVFCMLLSNDIWIITNRRKQSIEQEKIMKDEGRPFDLEKAKAGVKFTRADECIALSLVGVNPQNKAIVAVNDCNGALDWAPAERFRMLPATVTKYGVKNLGAPATYMGPLYDTRAAAESAQRTWDDKQNSAIVTLTWQE